MKECLQDITAKETIHDGTLSDNQDTNLEPKTWLDVFEAVAVYLQTIISRFRNELVRVHMKLRASERSE
jgi:hypothetical protein